MLRLVHSYLSLTGLILFLFFGCTGFMLNHEAWFGLDQLNKVEDEGEIPPDLCQGPDKLAIVEILRKDFGAQGPLHEFQVDDLELVVMFRRPGRTTDVVINREDGRLRVETQSSGAMALLTEIHMGKNVGGAGRLFIDAAAILLILAAMTGLILWMTIPNQRKLGLVFIAIGLVSVLGFVGWSALAN